MRHLPPRQADPEIVAAIIELIREELDDSEMEDCNGEE